jgi:hypothetical protein
VVSFAGTVPTGGKTVSIQTSFGYTATLVHLGSIGVARGALVGEASVVGTVGPSGVVDLPDPYVYFGARVTSDPQGYVDPLTLLPPRFAAPAAGSAPVADVASPAAAESVRAESAPPVSEAPPAAATAPAARPAPVATEHATPVDAPAVAEASVTARGVEAPHVQPRAVEPTALSATSAHNAVDRAEARTNGSESVTPERG